MTDAEIDTLAREILTRIVTQILGWDTPLPFDDIAEMDSGELIPVYSATMEEQCGSFDCRYMPLDPIRKLIVRCEQMYDAFPIKVTNTETGSSSTEMLTGITNAEIRDSAIRTMAQCATMHLIGTFKLKLTDLLEEAVKDSELIATTVLSAVLAKQLNKVVTAEIIADMRTEIEEAAERVADKKRTLLRNHIKALPHVLAERRVGRPKGSTKPKEKKAKEAAVFRKQVEDAIGALCSLGGALPKKTAVAKYLGIGGISPEGSNTYLSTFRTKLKRLNLDYKEIAEKVNK